MRYVRMVDIGGVEVGTTDREFEIIYNNYYKELSVIANKNLHLYRVGYDLTVADYDGAMDSNGKFDNYMEPGVQNQLEMCLYDVVKGFCIYVQYAYDFLQDIQAAYIRDIEDNWLGGRNSEGYYTRKRKRAIDMKLVLRTHTTHIYAYRDLVMKLKLKLS